MDIFGTVFQNTRVIWLLYKRWQNLIHKSMLRIHFKKSQRLSCWTRRSLWAHSKSAFLHQARWSIPRGCRESGSRIEIGKHAVFVLAPLIQHVVFGRKAAPFQFQTSKASGWREGVLSVSWWKLPLKKKKASHQLATRGQCFGFL